MSNPDSSAAAAGGGGGGGGGASRAPRLPRWTRQEILVLIQGKRVVEGRGRTRGGGGGAAAVEPKWAAVAAYCRRHGVDRGAVQCRKRWSNLAGDYKKIKDWERGKGRAPAESFWVMRNDVRREQRLPGFFDREVYDILDGAVVVAALEAPPEKEEEAVFDSGRTAAEDGLFSDGDDDKDVAAAEEEDEDDERTPPPPPQPQPPLLPPPAATVAAAPAAAAAAPPISEKKIEQILPQPSDHPGMAKDKHPAESSAKGSPSEKGSPSVEGHKRRRTSEEETGDTSLQSQLIEVLDRNSRVLASHLEAQNVNCQLDRDQRKEQADSLLGVLGKLADAIGRIADKL